MMWLNSEISGSVGGRSAYLVHDRYIDDENSDGCYRFENGSIHFMNDVNVS